MTVNVDSLLQYLWQPLEDGRTPQVYAVLDAAGDDAIHPKLMSSDVESISLFRGEKAKELAMVAPYLVKLDHENPFTHWLVENGWGNGWGIFTESDADIKRLRRHFQSILQVVDEEGNSMFFRYYDPRVLRIYLPTCNDEEINIFFGPICKLVVEGDGGNEVIEYTRTADKLKQQTIKAEKTAS